MHPASGDVCDQIIDAHSISRCAALASLADSGNHVLSFHPISARDLSPTPQRIGLRKASTFRGMCQRHDALFRQIDNQAFSASAEQCAQVAFRSVALDSYKKLSHVAFLEDAGASASPVAREITDFEYLEGTLNGASLGLADMLRLKEAADTAISTNVHALRYRVLRFGGPPLLAATGVFTPDFDLSGRRLQDLSDAYSACDVIAFSVIPSADSTDVLFAWKPGANAPMRFVETFFQQPRHELAQLVPQIALGYVEGVYFSAEWWCALSDRAQSELKRLVRFYSSAPLPRSNEHFLNWAYDGPVEVAV